MAQTFKPLSITEQIAYSTVKIKTDTGSGTGFLFKKHLDNQKIMPFIITNKHVVKGTRNAEIVFHIAKDGAPSGETIKVEIDNFESRWIMHSNPDVDLCAIPIGPFINEIKEKKNQDIFTILLEKNIIPNNDQLEQLSYAESIMMAGYPNGLSDEVNNYPIFRKGITATHPFINYNDKKEFVVDIACFPGSSGSPIFIINEGSFTPKLKGLHRGDRIYFLGILRAGPQISSTGEIIIQNIPTNFKLIPDIKNMMHLGFAIKSSEVITLIDQIKVSNESE